MIARIESAACLGIKPYGVHIEVDVSSGLPQLTVVGLPDASVKESRERVRSAIKNSGFRFPPEKITINLAPADIKKEGPSFDLPIALGILAAGGMIEPDALLSYTFLGELALDGKLRPFKGAIVIAEALKQQRGLIVPKENAAEAALASGSPVYGVDSLREAVQMLSQEITLAPAQPAPWNSNEADQESTVDFADVKGQLLARRAVEVSVAGGHNILLIGSPGSGKSMIARRIPSLLPPLSFDEALEITKIHSVSGTTRGEALIKKHPFRDPHHGISAVAMAGGGSWPRPGEVSLAHGGVLFLDEFPEFRRDVIETLRAPLEDGSITISRTQSTVTYPCRIMLAAAMNPCPCGFLTDPRKACRCSMQQIQRYQTRISGPILDRIDIHVEVPTLTYEHLNSRDLAEDSKTIRKRITACRELQAKRYKDKVFKVNALMTPKEMKMYASPEGEAKTLLKHAMKDLNFSARAYYKILKVARTIADLSNSTNVETTHIAEAIQYRALDRQWS